MAKKKKYSEMTIQELNVELIEVKSSLFNFRFQKSMQQLEHPQKITHTKKEIARIKTFIRKLELGIN
tara:strand:+ start:3157 stop:3357 length:201 start_codon:yes stop_codon:yes gene_type:complete